MFAFRTKIHLYDINQTIAFMSKSNDQLNLPSHKNCCNYTNTIIMDGYFNSFIALENVICILYDKAGISREYLWTDILLICQIIMVPEIVVSQEDVIPKSVSTRGLLATTHRLRGSLIDLCGGGEVRDSSRSHRIIFDITSSSPYKRRNIC